MGSQRKHRRVSKNGKPFVAGRKKELPRPRLVKRGLNILLNADIPLQDILGRFKLITGSTGKGKSNTIAVMMEEYFRHHVPIHLIDIEGEHSSFAKEYENVVLLTKSRIEQLRSRDKLKRYLKNILKSRYSLILDVSDYDTESQMKFLVEYFNTIWDLEDKLRIPLAIILEEAHIVVPQIGTTPAKQRVIDLAKRGRKRKIELTFVTQRVQSVDKNVITQADCGFLHKVAHPSDLAVYKALIPSKEAYNMIKDLKIGECIYINDGEWKRGIVRKRKTEHGAHTLSAKDLIKPKKWAGWFF